MRHLITAIFLLCLGCQPTTHDTLMASCLEARQAIGSCQQDNFYVVPEVTARCDHQMTLAEMTPGCVEVEQEYMACTVDFFTHIATHESCRPPSPQYRLWLSHDAYCQGIDLESHGCPDPY